MARPRKDSEDGSAAERMIDAFWAQLSRKPYRAVTAASVARQAGCNRATFYYHFDSIEDLAERAVEATVPLEVADLAVAFLAGRTDALRLDEQARRAVERLCLLTGEKGSAHLTERFKAALQCSWAERFGLDLECDDIQAVAAFMASGIVGVLGRWSGRPCDDSFDSCLQTISEVFSCSAMEFVRTRADGQTMGPPAR